MKGLFEHSHFADLGTATPVSITCYHHHRVVYSWPNPSVSSIASVSFSTNCSKLL